MFHPLALYIGARYTRAKRRNHFISFISGTSMIGLALGVMVLITVMSVMNGFEKELRQGILGVVSHATVGEYGGQLRNWERTATRLRAAPHVIGVAPFVHGEGMMYQGENVTGVLVRGIEPKLESEVSDLHTKLKQGSLDSLQAGEFRVALGEPLAESLGARVGDKVTLIVPQISVTAAGVLPRLKRFTVSAIFKSGMYQYDSALVLINLADASKIFQLEDRVSGLRLKLDDLLRARQIAQELLRDLDGQLYATDWTQQHSNYFRAVQMEKTVMFVILTLIIAVAAFNIVSTQVMTVTDKRSDIAILRTLGAAPATIMAIFMVQGTLIGTVGTVLGGIAGVTLALNVEHAVASLEHAIGFKFLPESVYYISDLPADMRWSDVVQITAVSFVMTLVATLYPAWRAARTQPAEALRHE
jgi:lipoprotein-releasing system permease protein